MLPERLRHLRELHNLTQRELATRLGMSEGAVGMWERGQREPSLEMVRQIAKIFNVSADYLLGITDDMTFGREPDPILREHPWLTRLPMDMRTPAADMLRADFLKTAVFRGGTGIDFDKLDDEALKRLVAELIRFHQDAQTHRRGKHKQQD